MVYTYNADGTPASQVTNNAYNPNAPNASTSYAYDLADRLTNVTTPNGSTTGYTYDGMGDRVSASTHIGSTSTYTTYLVDPSGSIPQILAEYPNSGLPTYYIPAGTLIGQDSGTAGGLSYFATDGLGSVRGTYNTSGTNTGVSNFDPYGATLPDYAVTGTGSHIGYTGALTDSNGLVYLNARYYNPLDADFLSSDPLVGKADDPATFNLYAYVGDNPITRTDPSGKSFGTIAVCAAALFDGAVPFLGEATIADCAFSVAEDLSNSTADAVTESQAPTTVNVPITMSPTANTLSTAATVAPIALKAATSTTSISSVAASGAVTTVNSCSFIGALNCTAPGYLVKGDKQIVDKVAKSLGMTPAQRKAFGDYIEDMKEKGDGGNKFKGDPTKPNNQKDYTYPELLKLGKEFLGEEDF